MQDQRMKANKIVLDTNIIIPSLCISFKKDKIFFNDFNL